VNAVGPHELRSHRVAGAPFLAEVANGAQWPQAQSGIARHGAAPRRRPSSTDEAPVLPSAGASPFVSGLCGALALARQLVRILNFVSQRLR
jgi:hypothetical protein